MCFQHRFNSRIISAHWCQLELHYELLFTHCLSLRLMLDLNQKICLPSMRLLKALEYPCRCTRVHQRTAGELIRGEAHANGRPWFTHTVQHIQLVHRSVCQWVSNTHLHTYGTSMEHSEREDFQYMMMGEDRCAITNKKVLSFKSYTSTLNRTSFSVEW